MTGWMWATCALCTVIITLAVCVGVLARLLSAVQTLVQKHDEMLDVVCGEGICKRASVAPDAVTPAIPRTPEKEVNPSRVQTLVVWCVVGIILVILALGYDHIQVGG